MIETHTVNALLVPRDGGGLFRSALTFLNGLVAPAFLFCAGLGFAIALWRRAPDRRPGTGLTITLVKKCLFIMLVGYSMHVPVFSLGGLLDAPAAVREGIFRVDILQIIAVSLLSLLGVALLFPSIRGRTGAAAALGLAVIAAGAIAGGTPVFSPWTAGLPALFTAYFSPEMSLFTLVPWAAYPAAGFVAGLMFMRNAAAGDEAGMIRRTTLFSGAALGVAALIAFFTEGLYRGDDFWYWSAEYVVIRMAAIVLLMCVVWFAVRRGGGPVARAVALFGRESLPVYYYHLLIVYGKDFQWSFVRLFPDGMGYAACGAMAGGLVLIMYLFALVWNSGKRRYPRVSALAVRGVVAGVILFFLLS